MGFLTRLALRPIKTVTDLVKKRKAENSPKATTSTNADTPVSAPSVPAAAPKPTENRTSTRFNKDGTVDFTDNLGNPHKFTAKEWKGFLAASGPGTEHGGGQITPEVQQALNPQATLDAQTVEQQRTQAEALIPEINNVPEAAIQNAQAAQDANSVGATSLLTNAQAIISGAAGGAALGSPGGPIGATIGAVLGGGGAVITKISISKKQSVKEANNNFKLARGNMDAIVSKVNNGTLAPADAVRLWNEQLATIRVAERLLKRETDSNVDRFVSGGADELATIKDFQKYELQWWSQDLANAIATPDPSRVRPPLNSDQENVNG
jgi:hypothetical protein